MRKLLLVLVLLACGNLCSAFTPALADSSTNTQPVRALHIVLRYLTVMDAKRLIDMAKLANFNTVLFDPRDKVKFNRFPGKVLQDAWSREEFLSVVKYAQFQGLEVIPALQLLSHQEQMFGDSHPELMFNHVTYDPSKELVYKLVYPYLDEIIELVHPSAIHIGHDELAGFTDESRKKWLLPGETPLPAELFLKNVLRIHDYLGGKKVKTWMWEDLLISREEVPGPPQRILIGTVLPRYGKQLRSQLPKDIVICDNIYENGNSSEFPTMTIFMADGFKVLGSTWRDKKTISNFSKFAAKLGAKGMIATTWFVPLHNKNIVVNSWDEVNQIIRESGEAFRKDFRDAQ